MPVPSLPLELVQHICDYLEVLYPLDRTGINVALTCRAWRDIGYRLSVRKTSISFNSGTIYRSSADLASRKARHFLDTPILLSFVEDLDLDTRHFYNSNLEEYLEEEFVRRILGQTSSLRRLGLTPSTHGGQEVLRALSTAPFPAFPVTHLEVNFANYDGIVYYIRHVLSTILRRIRLEFVRSLDLICADEDFPTFIVIISKCSGLRRLRFALTLLPFGTVADIERGGFSVILKAVRGLKDLEVLSIEQPPWGMGRPP
ncbi:Proteophosphoglycan 5 [Rhodotorula toruloides ATCC 204091]|uniref:BY PROTMAP: gi/342319669/gb/EGU11616.1/ Proteophosphoglycan 5 [Rhodotorula glutinis ATCC 204091] n=1 Tax=Rhodotorula toruloides TaxID=5286 RepID=A0A0K3CFZ5_RHOTO|nr:Proteophosphoglycan 5 [Rhodotorula toruloides ATCC 204091]